MTRFYWLLVVATFSVVFLWLLSPLFVLWIFERFQSGALIPDPGALGPLGDVFGAINALFSGLALSIIGVAFIHDLRTRRAARFPLIIFSPAELPATPLVLQSPEPDASGIRYPVIVRANVVNAAPDSALNILFGFRLSGSSLEKSESFAPMPGGGSLGQSPPLEINTSFSPSEMLEIARGVASSEQLTLTLFAEYSNVDGFFWRSSCDYSVNFLDDFRAAMIKLLETNPAPGTSWLDSKANFGLKLTPRPRTWKVREVSGSANVESKHSRLRRLLSYLGSGSKDASA